MIPMPTAMSEPNKTGTDAVLTEPAPGDDDVAATSSPGPSRKRPKPGERRIQILQTLAQMLEQPDADRITTAALAA
jgi:TetR/AcrR family transcriptional regulator